jgi:DNA polymerase-4
VLEVLREVCDKVEMMSIDEAYLDMSHQRLLFPSLREMGLTIKQAVFDKVKVTCSVGVAPNKYVAKMCTGENKPNGLTIMDIEDYRETFAPRKVSELVGVGRHLEEALNRLGIRTVAQLQTFPEKILQTRFGICGPHLKKMANGDYEGIISANFREQPEDKSVGHSCTLSRDISDMESIRATLLELSCKVARRLRQGNFQGKRVTLTLRYQDFSTYTHQASLNYFTNDEAEIYREAVKCLDESYSPGRAVRLLGVRVSHLQKAPNTYSAYQTDLFLGSLAVKKHCVLKAADDIRDRFGEKALYYGGVAEVGKLFYSRNYSRNFLRPEVAKG